MSPKIETQKELTVENKQLVLIKVPRAGAKILVTGGDICVFICSHQVIEHQLLIPFVEVVKTIPGKCGQMWPIVVSCGQSVVKCNLLFCRIMPNFKHKCMLI